eukprot:CAMPEP_0113665042 /NCGR_PEP_ID=MMETSP0038_2-20120614/2076_1 /TAXON_ID=2898 /ORGANISM="Cryptomonas paramecium" /LENGTH=113 /DNA_ID=CAMNT_0000580333 /DNA_START=252 /DNA_END=590 /DNA_ORIENTATION=- /assembly_acc=CAM_ASM_000170
MRVGPDLIVVSGRVFEIAVATDNVTHPAANASATIAGLAGHASGNPASTIARAWATASTASAPASQAIRTPPERRPRKTAAAASTCARATATATSPPAAAPAPHGSRARTAPS